LPQIDYDRVAIVSDDTFDMIQYTHDRFQTDEQAPLPVALAQLLERIKAGLTKADDFIFNCQMGRGRTTTGMVTACLVSTILSWTVEENSLEWEETLDESYDWMDGPSEEEAYLQGKVPHQ
jgi:Inositol hexakisphosphate